MGRRRELVGGSLLAVALAACTGGAVDTTTTTIAVTTTTVPPTTATTVPEPLLVSEDLAGFEPRSVVFANLELAVTGVRLSNQDLRSYAEGGEPEVDEERFHAFLDVTATNRMSSTLADGLEVETYQLRIGEEVFPAAEEMGFLSDLTGLISPNTAVDTFLAFPVPADTDLGGATLVIGVPPDRPATLPLTGSVPEPVFPIEVELEGSAEGVGPTNQGTVVFTVLGAVLSEDLPQEQATSPTGLRADEDELFLVLHVRAEKVAGPGAELLNTDTFRLLVDGTPRSPWDSAADPAGSPGPPTLDPGAAADAWVAFLIPVDSRDLVLEVGDFAADPGLIPIPLPDLP